MTSRCSCPCTPAGLVHAAYLSIDWLCLLGQSVVSGHIVLTMVGSEVLILGLLTCDVPAPLL